MTPRIPRDIPGWKFCPQHQEYFQEGDVCEECATSREGMIYCPDHDLWFKDGERCPYDWRTCEKHNLVYYYERGVCPECEKIFDAEEALAQKIADQAARLARKHQKELDAEVTRAKITVGVLVLLGRQDPDARL